MPFRDLVGHRTLLALLSRSIQQATLPPSLIFAGPSGVGKRRVATARPDMLLPTVQSRCPRLRFRPLSAQDVAAVLVRSGYTEERARAVAAIAGGSAGRALEADAEEATAARAVAHQVLAAAAAAD